MKCGAHWADAFALSTKRVDGRSCQCHLYGYLGLATLIEAMRNARKQSTRLILRSVQTQPRYLLTVTDLDHVFEIQETANP